MIMGSSLIQPLPPNVAFARSFTSIKIIHPDTNHYVLCLISWKSQPLYQCCHKSQHPQQGCRRDLYPLHYNTIGQIPIPVTSHPSQVYTVAILFWVFEWEPYLQQMHPNLKTSVHFKNVGVKVWLRVLNSWAIYTSPNVLVLTLNVPNKICSRWHSKIFIFYFSEKTSLDISCELSAWQTIHMKYQDLFSSENKKKKIKIVVCFSCDRRFKG